jgi:3'-5' exoribonuclease
MSGHGSMNGLAQLTPGAPFEGVYAVREVERRLSRAGKPFLSVVLADATGSARGVVFDQPDWFAERLVPGAPVRVAGRVEQRAGRLELRISHVRPADDAEAETGLVPRSHRDPEELFGFVLHLADEVADPGLRATLDALTGDAALAEAWRTVPCTRSGHHAYIGGLIEHTVGVAALCQTLCTWHPRVDSDLLVAAAICHDLGYTRAWSVGTTFEPTEEGRLLGHVGLGVEIVGAAARTAGLAEDRRLALLHCVAWHHGPPPPALPQQASPEALALMRLNAAEVQVKSRLEGGRFDGPML